MDAGKVYGISRRAALALLVCVLFGSLATDALADPKRYPGVGPMLEALGQYTKELQNFDVSGSEPVVLELRPIVDAGDSEATRSIRAKQAVIYGVYRTFLHTDAKSITVRGVPQEFVDGKPNKLDKFACQATVDRARAASVLKQSVGAGSLDDLLTADGEASTTWDSIAIEEQTPGPERVFELLRGAK